MRQSSARQYPINSDHHDNGTSLPTSRSLGSVTWNLRCSWWLLSPTNHDAAEMNFQQKGSKARCKKGRCSLALTISLARLHRSLVVQGMLAEPAVEVHLPLKGCRRAVASRNYSQSWLTPSLGSTTLLEPIQSPVFCTLTAASHRASNRQDHKCWTCCQPGLAGTFLAKQKHSSRNPSLSIVCTHKEIKISVPIPVD